MKSDELKKDDLNKSIYSLLFNNNDDVKRLTLKLRSSKDVLGKYIFTNLSPPTKESLSKYKSEKLPLPNSLCMSMVDDLYTIMRERSIYDEAHLESARLTLVAEDLRREIKSKEDLAKFNQLLLAEFYPLEIKHGLKRGSTEWHKYQVEKYSSEKPYYEDYSKTLKRIMGKICEIYAPLAIVMAREKSLPSFAEKALKKDEENPAYKFTDLCGARVITETQKEVNNICRFIESNFEIDVENSLDALSRLKTAEFGYRSIHYIVQLRSRELLGVDIPSRIGDRKAEIQVRTLLQHAWASIYHDRLYKTELIIPEQIKRKISRVSALLEAGDDEFADVVETIDAYKLNYGAYMKKDKIGEKIEMLKMLFNNERVHAVKRTIAIQIAKMSRVAGDWKEIIDYLDEFIKDECRESAEILTEHGYALCKHNKDKPKSQQYKKGQEELHKASECDDLKIRVLALSNLAWTYKNTNEEEVLTRKYYMQAFNEDPSNPYSMLSYIECEIYYGAKSDFLVCMEHAFDNAIKTCRAHIDAGIEVPWSYLTIGKLFLLLGKWYESLSAYLKAVQCCISRDTCIPDELFEMEMEFLRNINRGKELQMEHQWVRKILLLARYLKYGLDEDKEEISILSIRRKDFKKPVIIVVGGTNKNIQKQIEQYADSLIDAFSEFKGTIISGGTKNGIPGIIGDLSSHLKAKKSDSLDVIGYLPESIPVDFEVDNRYTENIKTQGHVYNPSQSIQVWIDLISNGIIPSDVKLLCINGEDLSAFECKLALTLGATVGIIKTSGGAATDLLKDSDWSNTNNLLWMPDDKMTIKPFVYIGNAGIDWKLVEILAVAIHDEFLKENRYKSEDPTMLPWDLLLPTFQESNRQQAAYATEVLRKAGYGVRAKTGAGLIKFPGEEIEIMSEMEHGRWVVERLKNGWVYAEKRDPRNKKSPYLVPWDQLSDKVKNYDREAIRRWPALFGNAGLEIYKLSS